jgi:signal transduction histidine kinase
VILNLTLNSIQAVGQEGEVHISARKQDQTVRIDVCDNGIGIEEADLEKIFDPFYTTKENGTGIGLYVVHQIVTQHGGQILVKRNKIRGMTFSVLLPERQPSFVKAARLVAPGTSNPTNTQN